MQRGSAIALLYGADEALRPLEGALEAAGFRLVIGRIEAVYTGGLDLEILVHRHGIGVIIWDLDTASDPSWQAYRRVRNFRGLQHCRFVITCDVHRLVDSPFDLFALFGEPGRMAAAKKRELTSSKVVPHAFATVRHHVSEVSYPAALGGKVFRRRRRIDDPSRGARHPSCNG